MIIQSITYFKSDSSQLVEDIENKRASTKIQAKYEIPASKQKLIYKGKIMSCNDEETLFYYNVHYNETIQVHKRVVLGAIENISITNLKNLKEKHIEQKKEIFKDCDSLLYAVGDLVDVHEIIGAYYEAKIIKD